MSIAQIITLALVFLAFYLGYKTGHNDGYVKGRIAVRRYYEAKASK
jgi:hypothetical protein